MIFDEVKNIRVYPSGEMSNEDYHADEAVSGSELHQIFSTCPAQYRYGEKEETQALLFGTAAHSIMLEPEKFESLYLCGIDEDAEGALSSDTAVRTVLKDMGIPVKSTTAGQELFDLFEKSGCTLQFNKLEKQKLEQVALESGKTVIKKSDFDTLIQMRNVIHANKMYADLLKGAYVETSIFAEVRIGDLWCKVKIRPDIITHDFSVPDYKTTADMMRFPLQAHDAGYWLKMAFQHDILMAAYPSAGEPRMGFLAQCKKAPYIPQLFWLSKMQIITGREQYMYALKTYQQCKNADIWPAYFDEAVELPTPDFIAKRYGFDN